MKKIYGLILLAVILVPLGLLSASPAWGEWENDFYQSKLGFIPKGIARGFGFDAPLPDYSVGGTGAVTGYYLSAVLGVILIFGIFYLISKVLRAR